MILYLDASALVKRYIAERESLQVNDWIEQAEMVVTGLITRVEVAAAICRVRRMQYITGSEEQAALRALRADWESLHRLPVSENTVLRAEDLACEHHLRGYDAIHLACALTWQELLGLPVTLAAFDAPLIQAARDANLKTLPALTP